MSRPICIAALALLSLDAFAVQPPENTSLGFGPVEIERVHTYRPDMQQMLSNRLEWRTFTDGEGAGWEARFDEVTRTPRRMWGPGIHLGPLTSEADAQAAAERFVSKYSTLLGLDDAEIREIHATYIERTDQWYVNVVPTRDGLTIHRAAVSLRIHQDKVVMVGADTWPDVPVTGAFSLSEAAALRTHVFDGSVPSGRHVDMSAERILLPIVDGNKPELRSVWRTRSKTAEPAGHWEGFVDAQTGELLHMTNHVRFFGGQLQAEHDIRLGNGPLMVSSLRYAKINTSGVSVFSEEDGTWFSDDAGPWEVSLNGSRVRVVDEREGSVRPNITEGDITLTAADFGDSQAAVTTFVYLHQVQDWARELAPEVPWSDEKVKAFVNLEQVCNAYFDGDVNFFSAGGGCRNTGRLADVIFHEWGHGFHTYSISRGNFYDGSVGEGAADTMSFLMTDDSRVAPGFFTRSNGALRNTNNDARYPEDYETNEAFIHTNGLIFGGSMWDTREALRNNHGEPYATETTSAIYAGLLKGGPAMDTAYDEAIFADDDDADLSNGTPHQCELVEGFGKHGLGPAGGLGISPEHDPIVTTEVGKDTTVMLALDNPAPDCLEIQPETAKVHYSINASAWNEIPLDIADADIEGSIPGAALGDLVQYWVEVRDANGSRYTEPAGGPIRPHTFYVGDVLEVHCNDFEQGDGGYTHELVSGEESEGADDWQHGEPIGLGGDPFGCYSGDRCWGNDLGGGQFNGEYQNDKSNRLTSSVIKTGHYTDTMLHYRRWLSVEDGHYDQARIYADDLEIWSNWATNRNDGGDHHVDDSWAAHVVDLGAEGDDGEVQISWDITSDAGLTFGGWTIDDVCIYAPATPDNRLGIDDFVVTRTPDQPAPMLAWSMPEHAPLDEVVVVRKFGGYPTGPNDGTVVTRATSPELGAPVAFRDPGAVGKGNVFYAVYASDGEEWLSWTREGLNAGSLDVVEGAAGCGCNGNGGSSAGFFALLALLGFRRRH